MPFMSSLCSSALKCSKDCRERSKLVLGLTWPNMVRIILVRSLNGQVAQPLHQEVNCVLEGQFRAFFGKALLAYTHTRTHTRTHTLLGGLAEKAHIIKSISDIVLPLHRQPPVSWPAKSLTSRCRRSKMTPGRRVASSWPSRSPRGKRHRGHTPTDSHSRD